MTRYTDECIAEMIGEAVRIVIAWDDGGKRAVRVTDRAKAIAKRYGYRWGAVSDRIRNFMWLYSGMRYGRKDKYAPDWVMDRYFEAGIGKKLS